MNVAHNQNHGILFPLWAHPEVSAKAGDAKLAPAGGEVGGS